jgi:uncharacterized protein YndB with AHSA1/START domain
MMFKTLLILIALLIAAVLIVAATRPDRFRTERSLEIAAPPEKIFPLIDDLRRWRDWSPYEKKDPAMQRTLSGPPAGVGAQYEWKGNKEVGQGRMEIVESRPSHLISIQLDFISPFEAHNIAEFTLAPAGNGTRVTWALSGPSPYLSKLIGLFMNMDRMIGTDFEAGLASLKTLAES